MTTITISAPMKRTFMFAGSLTAILGIAFAAVAVAAPTVLDSLYLGLGPSTVSDMGPAARLGAGIYGGLMTGWGVMMALIGRGMAIERATTLSLLAWWLVDSSASVVLGYPLNALSNAAFLIPFVPVFIAAARGPAAPATAET